MQRAFLFSFCSLGQFAEALSSSISACTHTQGDDCKQLAAVLVRLVVIIYSKSKKLYTSFGLTGHTQ